MEWIVEPLSGFDTMNLLKADECSGGASLNLCKCSGGLLVCKCSDGLKIEPQ